MPAQRITLAPGTVDLKPRALAIPVSKRQAVADACYQLVINARSDRGTMDTNLDYYTQLYEMVTGSRNFPWPNASSVFMPLIPTMLETLVSQLAGGVFIERLLLVSGNTLEAAQVQHDVEHYYNVDWARRGVIENLYQCMHLGARDGTSYAEIVYEQRKQKQRVAVRIPITDELTGQPMPDSKETDGIAKSWQIHEMEITTWDAPKVVPVESRDLYVCPAWYPDLQTAPAVDRILYLSENDLRAMATGDDKVLWMDAVDHVCRSLSVGQSDMPQDPRGNVTYQAGTQINIGAEMSTSTSAYKQQRGPFMVHRIHTNIFDFDGDGYGDEGILFFHEITQTLLGAMPMPYWHMRRPFEDLTLMPRPGRGYGYGVPERLRGLQEEKNAIWNARNDRSDLELNAPFYEVAGTKVEDQKRKWGPGARYTVTQPSDIGLIALPQFSAVSYQQEAQIDAAAMQLLGLGMVPGSGSGGRKTKAEINAASAMSGVRVNLMATRLREFIKRVFWQYHHLNVQYGPDTIESAVNVGGKPTKLTIPKQSLMQDFDLSVAGIGGPLDKTQRQQTMLFVYNMLLQNPLVAGDLSKVWYATRMLLEEFDRPDILTLIGTLQEAQQKMQAQQQAAQQQQQLAQIAAQHGQSPNPPHQGGGGGGGGKRGGLGSMLA